MIVKHCVAIWVRRSEPQLMCLWWRISYPSLNTVRMLGQIMVEKIFTTCTWKGKEFSVSAASVQQRNFHLNKRMKRAKVVRTSYKRGCSQKLSRFCTRNVSNVMLNIRTLQHLAKIKHGSLRTVINGDTLNRRVNRFWQTFVSFVEHKTHKGRTFICCNTCLVKNKQ